MCYMYQWLCSELAYDITLLALFILRIVYQMKSVFTASPILVCYSKDAKNLPECHQANSWKKASTQHPG